jgi:hypothetical protein
MHIPISSYIHPKAKNPIKIVRISTVSIMKFYLNSGNEIEFK